MVGKSMIPVPFENYWERLPGLSDEFLVETVDDLLVEENLKDLKINSNELVDSMVEKDWRADKPNVLQLIDPLLHCFTPQALPIDFKYKIPWRKASLANKDEIFYSWKYFTCKFHCLPTEFLVDATTKKATTLSYINNLDPRNYENLYKSVELVVEAAVPYFEQVLSDLVSLDNNYKTLSVTLTGRPLQIIVGMQNIYLTPKKPKYAGGKWHIDGMKNERIVASAIYYYDVFNITEILAFRVIANASDAATEIGSVVAQSNRLVVFPNLYEHSVLPFELANKSQPGYRKVITLFLVDPATKILSTGDVPPLQKAWYPITGKYSHNLLTLPGKSSFSTENMKTMTLTLRQAKINRKDAIGERRGYEPPSRFFGVPTHVIGLLLIPILLLISIILSREKICIYLSD